MHFWSQLPCGTNFNPIRRRHWLSIAQKAMNLPSIRKGRFSQAFNARQQYFIAAPTGYGFQQNARHRRDDRLILNRYVSGKLVYAAESAPDGVFGRGRW